MAHRIRMSLNGIMVCLASLFVAHGCSAPGKNAGDGATTTCRPGDTRECAGPGACRGGQECVVDGSGFGECVCGAKGSTGGRPNLGGGVLPISGDGGTSSTDGGTTATGGGTTSTGDAGATGSGGAGSDSAGAAGSGELGCDPVTQSGSCEAGTTCRPSDEGGVCSANGAKAELEVCDSDEQCGAGLYCHMYMNCVRACRTKDDCSDGEVCGFRSGFGDDTIGACVKPCDMLKQDCALANQGCYYNGCLTRAYSGSQGEDCFASTQCAEGLDCLGDYNQDQFPDCTRYCSPTGGTPSCAEGYVCHKMNEYYPGFADSLGLCVVP